MKSQAFNAGVVLVVDDDVDVLRAIQHMLELEGYRVLAVSDPRQGLQTYSDHSPEIQVVVLDYHMHGMCGDEMLERLQQINTEVRAIMITGDGEEISQRLEGHRLFGFLRKPFSPVVFLDLIGNAVGSSRARDLAHPQAA